MPRLKTILHPRWSNVKSKDMPSPDSLSMNDYIAVPAIATYGTWSVLDLLSLDDKASLFGLYKFLEKGPARARA